MHDEPIPPSKSLFFHSPAIYLSLSTSSPLCLSIGDASRIAGRIYPTQIASNGSECHANAYHLLPTTVTLGSPLKELVHPQQLDYNNN